MKKILTIIVLMLFSAIAFTQERKYSSEPWKINLNVHYTTQHYWRGIGRGGLFGKAPAFESTISFSNPKWYMGVFAGASMDNIYKTVMPFVMYRVTPQFAIAIQDIYSPGTNFWQSEPFDFDIHKSKHFVDYYMVYKFKKLPIGLKWASVVLGADPNDNGKRNFSSYFEISSSYQYKNWKISGAVGYTPWKGLYASEAGINNIEATLMYNLKVNDGGIALPVYVKATYNTITKYSHFIAGVSINLKIK